MRRTIAIALSLLALIAGGLYAWRFQMFRVRPIIAGEFFRSKQPSAANIEEAVRSHGIRTIINLRGHNPKRDWYREEAEAARKHDLALVSLPLETFDWPPKIETQRFISAIATARTPALVHCATGVDRTGWASAVIRAARGHSLAAALEEMSRARGHLCDIDECPLHRFFAMYESWLASNRLIHTAENFRRWASEIYCPVPYDAEITLLEAPPPSAAPGQQLRAVVRVVNRSPEAWIATSDSKTGIRLGARTIGPFPTVPPDGLDRLRAPRADAPDVFRDHAHIGVWPPGTAREVELIFEAPGKPGVYLLQVDMVDEYVHWFSDLGRPGLIVPLTVTPPPSR
jgi:protein tyrosine phosphatase (PTP) superfamily phosphohydrolase (DUF442 family)